MYLRSVRALLLSSAVLAATAAVGQAPEPDKPPEPFPARKDAKAIITTINGAQVPAQWPLGVPIMLSAKSSVAGSRENSVGWTIDPPWVDQNSPRTDSNRVVSIGSGTKPKRITVTLTVAKDDTYDSIRMVIDAVLDPNEPGIDPVVPKPVDPVIPRPVDPVIPSPVDPVIPSPVDPPGPALNELASAVAAAVRSSVPAYAGRPAMAAKLGGVYAQASGNIAQAAAINPTPANLVPYKTPEGIVKATGQSVQASLGGEIETWRPFFAALRTILNDLGAKGKLATAGDHVAVWKDIAAGLRSIN